MAYRKIDQLTDQEKNKRRSKQKEYSLKTKREVYDHFAVRVDNGNYICQGFLCGSVGGVEWPISCFNLDHINDNGKGHVLEVFQNIGSKCKKGGAPFLYALLKDGIEKHKSLLQLICANCHAYKTANGSMLRALEIARTRISNLCTQELNTKAI